MDLAEELTRALSIIYDSIKNDSYSKRYRQDLVETISSLEYTLLKVNNPGQYIDHRIYNKMLDTCEERFDHVRKGGDWTDKEHTFKFEDYEEPKERTREEIRNSFRENLEKIKKKCK